MRKAVKSDLKLAVNILSNAFKSNPSVNWVVKNDSKINKRIIALCEYSFKTAIIRDGAYVSDDNNGIALCYKYNGQKESLIDYWNQFLLAVRAIGLSRVLSVLKREAYAKSKRPANGEFLYFWFLGVLPGKQNGIAAKELKEYLFNLSDKFNLPIYLETSVEKNKTVYERIGFEVYHTQPYQDMKYNLYFMRRFPVY